MHLPQSRKAHQIRVQKVVSLFGMGLKSLLDTVSVPSGRCIKKRVVPNGRLAEASAAKIDVLVNDG